MRGARSRWLQETGGRPLRCTKNAACALPSCRVTPDVLLPMLEMRLAVLGDAVRETAEHGDFDVLVRVCAKAGAILPPSISGDEQAGRRYCL